MGKPAKEKSKSKNKSKPVEATATDKKRLYEDFENEEKKITDWMLENSTTVVKERKQFMQKLLKKRCCYGREGSILPITISPLFLKEESVNLIAEVGETLDRILDKMTYLYFQDEHVASYFPYTDIPKEWIAWDPGYEKPTILNRHDAIFDGKNLKFIEFNTDNPGGRGWCDTIEHIFREYPIYQDLIKKFAPPEEQRMLHSLKDSLLSCYEQWGGKKKNPRVALVSFKKYLPGSDDEIVRDFLIENGIETNFVDARDFEYRKGKLYSGNVPFDIVNLTLRFTFFKRFPNEMRDFLAALRDKNICCVNHFRALIASHKEALSFLTNEENHHYFTKEEAECIKKYVPWTRKMDETITISKEGTDISLLEYVLKNQDQLVLKPTAGAGGYDVFVGKFTDKDKWQSAIESSIGCPWWIVQDAVEIPEYEFPVLKDSKVVMEKKNLNVNPYIFNGKYVGCLGRISQSKVINVSAGGGMVPIFRLQKSL